ncbi:CPBP family intramembrane glutamic endopeptidase [Tuberibacillus sp. Marseille-P3662]|uniref:CPBP family intramembrane glutamic endopeptidase n=1 Tax=Tuberibacillus sp. Marseille-P3662 TaxID=1965358 RepID=UPI000A1CF320|nr:type II CAAX endopeptidase family protein [Tuberibacillus sp. Marseille-P3662]
MPKRYWYILLVYVLWYLSPLLLGLFDIKKNHIEIISGYWMTYSFLVALPIIIWLLRTSEDHQRDKEARVTLGQTIVWAIVGIFMTYVVQMLASIVDVTVLGNKAESTNTQNLMGIAEQAPIAIISIALLGPIVEEIVFRKVIFGSFYKRFNFWLSALFSALIFAVFHFDAHIIVYGSIGFVFAYLYAKTKRIIVPIISHMVLNSLSVILFFFRDDLLQYYEDHEQQLQLIWGVFF